MQQPVVLITGGDGTLAGALRTEFAAAGWAVHAPGRAEMDVTSPSQVQDYFAALTRLDLLIHNAGVIRDAPFLSQDESCRDTVLDVCLRGAFLCSRAAARLMVPQGGGHLVHIGSHSALTGPPGQTAYAAAKAGLTAFTKSLAAELGPHNIRVNTVLPGWLESKMTAAAAPAVRRQALEAHALGRFNTAADTARFLLFLHSMTAVSGQVFSLDSRLSRSGL